MEITIPRSQFNHLFGLTAGGAKPTELVEATRGFGCQRCLVERTDPRRQYVVVLIG